MDLQSLTHPAYRRTANGRTRSAEAPAPLTAREREVLDGLAAGLSDREVALRVMLFEPALRAALRSIYRKLGVRSRQEAAAYRVSRRRDSFP
jgi:DNA-binding NarL/FixJ family response regulator